MTEVSRERSMDIRESLKQEMQKRTPSSVTLFHSIHQDALALDFGVLGRLLKSNRAAHSRTKYFQRLDMCYRCLRKHDLMNLFADYQNLSKEISETVEGKKKQKKREEVFWDFAPSKAAGASSQDQTKFLLKKMGEIGQRVKKKIPEAISRIEYASQSVFLEMARGYFLPFCSIAVASLARIRVLLQRLGSQILYEWVSWQKNLLRVMGNSIEADVVWDPTNMMQLQQKFNPSKASSVSADNQQVHSAELLKELGITLDTDIVENQTSESDKECKGNEAKSVQSEAMLHREDDDLGECLSSHKTTKIEESAPDYMDAAIEQVQNNFAFAKKAMATTTQSQIKLTARGSKLETNSDVGDATPYCKSNGTKKPAKKEITDPSLPSKQKKKKRRDSSKPKASKKAKSGDFFDHLFR